MALRSAALNVMVKAAQKAARDLVRDYGEVGQLLVSRKGPGDFVTAADRRAEETITAELTRARPGYGLLLEEGGATVGEEESTWIVDPLDGTTNFLHGLPHFAISIALRQKGEITAGVVFDPVKDEMFVTERGGGAYLNDRRIRTASRIDLETAVIGCGMPVLNWSGRDSFDAQYRAVADRVAGLRRWGTASLDLAYVACGRYDGYWEHGLKPWDLAAGVLLIREAGGTVTTLEGTDPFEPSTLVVGTIGVQPKLMRLLAGAAAPSPAKAS